MTPQQIIRLEATLDAILFAHTSVGSEYPYYSVGTGFRREGNRNKSFNRADSYRKNRADELRKRRANVKVKPEQAARVVSHRAASEHARALEGFHKINESRWKAGMAAEYAAAGERNIAAAAAKRTRNIKIGAGAAALLAGGAIVAARRKRPEDDITIPR